MPVPIADARRWTQHTRCAVDDHVTSGPASRDCRTANQNIAQPQGVRKSSGARHRRDLARGQIVSRWRTAVGEHRIRCPETSPLPSPQRDTRRPSRWTTVGLSLMAR
jgi:hypothetical protein